MSDTKPATRALLFFDSKSATPEQCVATVNVSAAKIVRNSNFLDLRDDKNATVATLTWPSTYRVKET